MAIGTILEMRDAIP